MCINVQERYEELINKYAYDDDPLCTLSLMVAELEAQIKKREAEELAKVVALEAKVQSQDEYAQYLLKELDGVYGELVEANEKIRARAEQDYFKRYGV